MTDIKRADSIDRLFLVSTLILTPLIIYLYFLQWKTGAINGDDLIMYRDYHNLHSVGEQINMPLSSQKYRPIHGLSVHLIIEWFQKNLHLYYLFNVTVQTFNTLVLAYLLNVFLRAPVLSWIISLLLATSRFALFTLTQLLNGGALEGLAISFFLVTVVCLVKSVQQPDSDNRYRLTRIGLALLFANLASYTHERYLVLFPFIIGFVLLYPALRKLGKKNKAIIVAICVASVVLNVVLKVYVYHIAFFVGTGGTAVEISIASMFRFFVEALLSVFQINTGPEYLVGMPFSALPLMLKFAGFAFALLLLALVVTYVQRIRTAFRQNNRQVVNEFHLVLTLAALLGACLLPAIITIRLEQRWLMASFIVSVIMAVIIIRRVTERKLFRNAILMTYVLLMFLLDYAYLHRGAQWIYMNASESLAEEFRDAIQKGVIKPAADTIYLWEKKRDPNTEAAIRWTLGDGYLFEFYQDSSKQVLFEDSVYHPGSPGAGLASFNAAKDQIVFVGNDVVDLTQDFVRDSLRTFDETRINAPASTSAGYDPRNLVIAVQDMDKFIVSGFHNAEGQFRWSDGNSVIQFIGGYMMNDSITLELQTFYPDASKKVIPELTLLDIDKQVRKAVFQGDRDGLLTYRVFFDKNTNVDLITMKGPATRAPGDQRQLSFPFVSLRIRHK